MTSTVRKVADKKCSGRPVKSEQTVAQAAGKSQSTSDGVMVCKSEQTQVAQRKNKKGGGKHKASAVSFGIPFSVSLSTFHRVISELSLASRPGRAGVLWWRRAGVPRPRRAGAWFIMRQPGAVGRRQAGAARLSGARPARFNGASPARLKGASPAQSKGASPALPKGIAPTRPVLADWAGCRGRSVKAA